MRILICASGTGGHIYPAITFANKLQELGHEVCFIGEKNRLESKIIPAKNYEFIGLDVKRFDKGFFGLFKGAYSFFKNYFRCLKIVENYDRVIGFGNYVSLPVMQAAIKKNVKTFIHEQNSIPGKANLFLDKKVDGVFCSFDNNLKFFKNPNTFVSGNPQMIMKDIPIDKEYLTSIGLDNKKKTVLMFFGSLGSFTIDQFMQKFLKDFNDDYQIIYATGSDYFSNYKDFSNKNVKVFESVDGLKTMSVCDLLIARAGATTIAEIIALSKPSILIPSPYVSNNHQFFNAQYLVEKKASILLEEKDLEYEHFKKLVGNLINDFDKLKEIGENAGKLNNASCLEVMIKKVIYD